MTTSLLRQHKIISDQITPNELRVLLDELEKVVTKYPSGSIVELGCYIGTTSLFIRRLLDQHIGSNYEFHVYDSFQGLPEKTTKDDSPAGLQFIAGALHATKQTLITEFRKQHLQLPVIHKGWFSDLTQSDMPQNVRFAFLDGDYYESIRDSLDLITPRLTEDAVIVVDDYMNEALPGAKRAVDEWAKHHTVRIRAEASLAIIYLQM